MIHYCYLSWSKPPWRSVAASRMLNIHCTEKFNDPASQLREIACLTLSCNETIIIIHLFIWFESGNVADMKKQNKNTNQTHKHYDKHYWHKLWTTPTIVLGQSSHNLVYIHWQLCITVLKQGSPVLSNGCVMQRIVFFLGEGGIGSCLCYCVYRKMIAVKNVSDFWGKWKIWRGGTTAPQSSWLHVWTDISRGIFTY